MCNIQYYFTLLKSIILIYIAITKQEIGFSYPTVIENLQQLLLHRPLNPVKDYLFYNLFYLKTYF